MNKKRISVLMSVMLITVMVLSGCGSKTDEQQASDAPASEDASEIVDMPETGNDTETAAVSSLEIVYSDEKIELAQYKGLQTNAYVSDVDDDYVNEYIDSVLAYTYGNDEEGNVLYTADTMTDDVAAELMDGSGTANDYKELVKTMLEEESKKYYDETLSTDLLDQIIASSDLKEYDQADVDSYVEYLNGYYTAYAESVGMELSDYMVSALGYETEEEYNEGILEEAKQNVKIQKVIESICAQEGYEPTDEDKDAMVEKFVEMGYAESADAVRENLTEEEITINTMYYKVLDIIKENAVTN